MSLLSVKAYLAALAPSVSTVGLVYETIVGYRQRPKREKAGQHAILVVGQLRRVEDRETSPRGLAEKLNVYTVELLLYAEHSDEQIGGDHFDALCENVADTYRRITPGNPTLVDAVSGQTSYITHVGEHIDVELLPTEFAGANQSRIVHRAVLTLEVREILSPA